MCHLILLLPLLALPIFKYLPLEEAAFYYGLILIMCGILYWLMMRDMRKPASTGIEGMLGRVGTVIGKTRNGIKVSVKGETWDADCEDEVSEGEKVEVTGLTHLRLRVRKQNDAGEKL